MKTTNRYLERQRLAIRLLVLLGTLGLILVAIMVILIAKLVISKLVATAITLVGFALVIAIAVSAIQAFRARGLER